MIFPMHKAACFPRILPSRGRNWLCLVALTLVLGAVPARSQSLAPIAAGTMSDSSAELLARARASVQTLVEQSADVSCTERVTQSILDRYDRTAYEEHSLFNYRIEADTGGKALRFVESRAQLQAPFHDPGRTVLLTDGFGNMLLILHPAYAASYVFEDDGDEDLNGVRTARFRFKSVPGAISPVMLQIRGQNYSVALEGTVWIEPQQGTVVKLIVSSGSGMRELGIGTMRSEIQYLPTKLDDSEKSYWMPASAVIDVETANRHWHWRNIHRFSAYRRVRATVPTAEQSNR